MNCGSNKTHNSGKHRLSDGTIKVYPIWHFANGYDVNDGYVCHNCYARTKLSPRIRQRRIHYKDKRVLVAETNPRIGVCNHCRAVAGQIDAQIDKVCKVTNRHHEQYDDNHRLKYTIEICVRCHRKIK